MKNKLENNVFLIKYRLIWNNLDYLNYKFKNMDVDMFKKLDFFEELKGKIKDLEKTPGVLKLKIENFDFLLKISELSKQEIVNNNSIDVLDKLKLKLGNIKDFLETNISENEVGKEKEQNKQNKKNEEYQVLLWI